MGWGKIYQRLSPGLNGEGEVTLGGVTVISYKLGSGVRHLRLKGGERGGGLTSSVEEPAARIAAGENFSWEPKTGRPSYSRM